MTERRPEAQRDQAESGFTPILRRLWLADGSVLAVCFVDFEGECVDYCSSLDPFDAKILGAQMLVTVSDLHDRWGRIRHGALQELQVLADQRDLVARRVSEDYLLIVAVEAGHLHRKLLRQLQWTVEALRKEANIETPSWEPEGRTLEVEVRRSVGWSYAPAAVRRMGERERVAHVLGRRIDEDGLVCFRVRTSDGIELTLAHDPTVDRWIELDD